MTTKYIALFFCAFFTTTYNFSQVVFEEYTFKVFDPIYKSSIAHSDIDGDGDQDVFVTGYHENIAVARLYSNDGNGVFTEVSGTPFEGVSVGSSAFADIDGDGYEDLLVTGYTNNNQRLSKLYKNNGSGVFSEVPGTPFDPVSFSTVTFIDIDNDSDQDVLIIGYTSSNQRISKLYLNDGTGTFSLVAGTPFEGVSFGAIAFADINNDGNQDILITGENTAEQPIAKLYTNNGSGSFTEVTGLPFEGVYNSAVAFSDIDNDGDPDVIITGKKNYTQDISKLYRNNGNGSFTVIASPAFDGMSLGSVAFADIDNDSDPDLLLIGHSPYTSTLIAKLYTNNGTGGYTELNHQVLTGVKNGAITFIDVDNDGDQDLLATGLNALNKGSSKLYTNNGDGTFIDTSAPFIDLSYSAIAFADVDNDGDEDVLVTGTSNFNEGITALYLNDGAGVFERVSNTPFIQVKRGSIGFSDIDNDGDMDLFVTGQNDSGQTLARMYSNNGAGIFTEIPGTSFIAILAGAIAFADIDNDGDEDLFITGNNANQPLSRLYINNGTGTFTVSGETFANVYSSSVGFSDIDNDGDPDLLLFGNYAPGQTNNITKLYRNNGGTFSEITGTPFQNLSTGSISFADVDGDGDEDVVLAGKNTASQNSTKLYLNDGTGNFSEDVTVPFLDVFFSSIRFSDVDNDGDQDVLVTGMMAQATTNFYLNDGTGTFTEFTAVPFASIAAGAVAFSDIDNDGDMDVLISGEMQTKLYRNITCFSIDVSTSVSGNTIIANESNATYSWLDCNNNYLPVGVTTQSFSPTVNGSYAVEITQPGGCVSRSACVQISELGIQSHGTEEELLLFPNPADHTVTVKAPFSVEHYSVLDIQGRIVKEGMLNNGTIDLSNLESGSYLVNFKTEKQSVTRQIIKR